MWTTSRYASDETKSLARRLARRARERFVARGKRSVDALAEICRKAGDDRIAIVEENGGVPQRIAIISMDELGRWSWKEESVLNTATHDKADTGRKPRRKPAEGGR